MLDLSLDVVLAVIKGYEDRLLDQQLLAVQTGYWSAYYSGAKHPKPVDRVAEEMMQKHNRRDAKTTSAPRPAVDVEAFLAMEAQFQARLEQQGR